MTNVRLWILLWQKQIIDKHQRAGAGGVAASAGDYERQERRGLRISPGVQTGLETVLADWCG